MPVTSRLNFGEIYGLARDPDQVLREVLTRREFQASPWRDMVDRWWDEARRFALELFDRILSYLSGVAPSSEHVHWTVIILGASVGVLLLIGLGFAIRGVWTRMDSEGGGETPKPFVPVVGESRRRLSAAQWFRAAEEASREGKFSEAFMMLFRGRIELLRERGRLPDDPALTYRELLRHATDAGGLAPAYERMTPMFDFIRYGGGDCSEEDYRRARDLDDDFPKLEASRVP